MIKPRRSWLAYAAGVITCLTFTERAQAQAPATAANPNPTGVSEPGGQLQQITVTGYIIPRVGDGPQPVVTYDRDFIQKSGDLYYQWSASRIEWHTSWARRPIF